MTDTPTRPPCGRPSECRISPSTSQTMTLAYYAPVYDGFGRNLNPDRNKTTCGMRCATCGREWVEST